MAVRDDDAYFGGDPRIDEAMSQLAEQRRRFGENEQRRQEERTVVKAKDQSFSATFNGRGELVDFAFHGTKYRSAAPTELASQILSTLSRGRQEVLEKMMASVDSPALAGIDLAGLATGKTDPSSVLDSILAPILKGVSGSGPATGGPRG